MFLMHCQLLISATQVTDFERQEYRSDDPKNYERRGLLFNCYSSSLDSGFIRQTGFAGNDFFPLTSLVPEKHGAYIFQVSDPF